MKMDLGKLFVALVGLIIAGFGIAAMSLQIQTTEVWINGGGVASITPNYSIFTQPLDMLNGKISGNALIDVLVGWGIELTFIMCLIGFEHAHAGVRRGNSKLADVFVVGCIIVAAMNWLADYNYAAVRSGILGHVVFACIMSFVVAFFPLAGLKLIEAAFHSGGSSMQGVK